MLIHMANVLFVERLLYYRATLGQFKHEFELQAPFLVMHFVCVYRFYVPKGHSWYTISELPFKKDGNSQKQG